MIPDDMALKDGTLAGAETTKKHQTDKNK